MAGQAIPFVVRAAQLRFSYGHEWEALAEPKGTTDPGKHLQVPLTLAYFAEMTGESTFLVNPGLRVQGLGGAIIFSHNTAVPPPELGVLGFGPAGVLGI